MVRSSSRSAALKICASTAVIAWSLQAATSQAQQSAAADEVEEIVVTGYRASLEKAIDLKKSSDVQVDSILAEDIGKFPDLNLSESIQRIAGVAISRDGGEGRQISVRGLGPQFTRIRINGMEALTTAGGTDAAGGTNRGRSFDFNIFASDLFNAISIRKTAEAATEEGSLGATVDLRTARPFDYDGFTFTSSAQGGYNDLAKKFNPRAAALVSNTWHDGTFGVLASASYTKRRFYDVGTSTVRWATGNAFSPGFASAPASGPTLAQVNAAYHPRFPRFDQYYDDQERLGLTGSIQWKPRDETLVTIDALYADFKGTREEQFLEAPSFSVGGACTAANRPTTCGIADTDVTAATVDSANTLIAGTFNDVDLRVEDRFDKLDTKFTQFSATVENQFTDMLSGDVLWGHSKSDHDNPVQSTITLDQFNVQGYKYDYSQGRVPLLSYGSASLTDPTSWRLTQIRLRPQTAVNTYDTAQANLEFRPLDGLKFKAGFNWKQYEFNTTEMRRSIGTTSNQESVIPAALAAIPVANFSKVLTFKTKGLSAPAGSVAGWLVPDLKLAETVLSIYDQSIYNGAFKLGPETALGNNRNVKEDDTGGYVQGSFVTELGDMTLRGNAGVRYVETKLVSSGFSFLSGAPVAVTVENKYHNTLPSANLVLEPTDEFLVRASYARAMSRPDLGSLSPGASVSVSGSSRSVTAGNPKLKPFLADDYDLSFEWYPTQGTLVSVALFEKDVKSFVQTLSTTGTFTGNPFGIPDSVAIAACGTVPGCSPSASWNFSTPLNSPGGKVKGYELSYQQPFKFLPGLLANTGVLVNFTHVSSNIDYLNAAGVVVATNSLTGLSRKAYNATLYYEDDTISARISAAYRSKYLTRVPGQEAGTDVDGTNSTFNLDFSAQYTINENFKVSLEGINLTDEFQDQFNDSSNRVSFYHHTGREFLLGVRYTY